MDTFITVDPDADLTAIVTAIEQEAIRLNRQLFDFMRNIAQERYDREKQAVDTSLSRLEHLVPDDPIIKMIQKYGDDLTVAHTKDRSDSYEQQRIEHGKIIQAFEYNFADLSRAAETSEAAFKTLFQASPIRQAILNILKEGQKRD
jgi:uncharacterized damage-inducible protein DinB